jgi:hypothetical protein
MAIFELRICVPEVDAMPLLHAARASINCKTKKLDEYCYSFTGTNYVMKIT